jgi:hypothetical protein
MRQITMFFVVLSLVAKARADWPLEPKEFRGIPFPGASKAEVTKKFAIDDRFCQSTSCLDENFALADVPIQTLFDFANDKLVQIFMSFSSSAFQKVKAIFVERYGPPTTTQTSTVRTRGGVEYQNETVIWLGTAVEVHVVKYGTTVEDGAVLFLDRIRRDEETKAGEQARKKAAASF